MADRKEFGEVAPVFFAVGNNGDDVVHAESSRPFANLTYAVFANTFISKPMAS